MGTSIIFIEIFLYLIEFSNVYCVAHTSPLPSLHSLKYLTRAKKSLTRYEFFIKESVSIKFNLCLIYLYMLNYFPLKNVCIEALDPVYVIICRTIYERRTCFV